MKNKATDAMLKVEREEQEVQNILKSMFERCLVIFKYIQDECNANLAEEVDSFERQ